jgi:hypothetical protein
MTSLGQSKLPTSGTRWIVLLTAFALAAAGGCWQEIEYTAQEPTVTARAPDAPTDQPEELSDVQPEESPSVTPESTDAIGDDASGFANDFADSLADETPSEAEDPSSSPATPAEETAISGFPWENAGEAANNAAIEPPADQQAGNESDPTTDETTTISAPVEQQTAVDQNPSQVDSIAADETVQPADSAASDQPVEVASSGTSSETDAPTEPTTSTSNVPSSSTPPGAGETDVTDVRSTALDSWRLGSRLSLAALANDRGIADDYVASWLADCKTLAARLETQIADLPQRGLAGANQLASPQVLDHFLREGRRIGVDLARRHGPQHAALFEVAMKSNLLRVLYVPGSPSVDAISVSLAQAAPRAELPANLWQPLLDRLAAKAEAAEIRSAVRNFHAEVERHLAEQAKP